MREEIRYGTRYVYPEHPKELTGRIVSFYDSGQSDIILPNGRYRSEEEYDPDCEEYYVITGVVQTASCYVLWGRHMASYADVGFDVFAGIPLCALDMAEMHCLMTRMYADVHLMQWGGDGFYVCAEHVRIDLFYGDDDDFVKLYEEE